VIPETPPFATEGRLIGTLSKEGNNWIYEKFTGKFGASDLSGTVQYESKKPRPLVSANLTSNLLRLEDMAPLIGGGSDSEQAKRGIVQPPDKALPVKTFDTQRWKIIDAEVKFTGRKIHRGKNLPLDDLVTTMHLKDGIMSFTPLNFGVAGGNLISTLKLDGRNKIIKAEMKISARHLKLKQLFPASQPMQASIGEINGDALLTATGNSIARLLGSSNGEIKALVNQGTISKLLLEQIGLNVGSIVLTKLFGDKQVRINCMASDFMVTDGLMQTRNFVIDTEEAVLAMDGQINLAQEQLNLTIYPHSREFHVLSLRSPLYIKGSFKQPAIDIDKRVLVAKAGGAIALGILAPIATALIPLISPAEGNESGCDRLLQEAKEKPQAPPPGKTTQAKPALKKSNN
jgi:AsmA family protein